MRKYKAVVIDFKKLVHRGGLLLLAAASAAAAIYASVVFGGGTDLPEKIIRGSINVINTESLTLTERTRRFADKLASTLLGFVPTDGKSVIESSMPVYAAISDSVLIELAEERTVEMTEYREDVAISTVQPDIKEENRAPIKSIDAAQKPSQNSPVAIGNETSYGINIEEMLTNLPDIDMKVNGAKVLITHTHATESYAPTGAEVYDITASDRSEDKDKNVVAVGRKMKEVFERNGIETLHDEILHDVPSFNGSYAHSLSSVEEYIKNNPSIQIVFDLHRDSIVYDDNTKAKTVTKINGKNAAQLMFVVGTDANGLYNPNWRSNMQAALHFQKSIADKYPKLMRHINLRKERFNGHTSGASMIIEVGTSGNSIDEAMYSIELAAECIADYLKSL